jgi:hypothetical protein
VHAENWHFSIFIILYSRRVDELTGHFFYLCLPFRHEMCLEYSSDRFFEELYLFMSRDASHKIGCHLILTGCFPLIFFMKCYFRFHMIKRFSS